MWDAYFMEQIEAGMPGYMAVISDGGISICPQDETSDAVRKMVQTVLDADTLNIAGLKAAAARSGNRTAFQDVQNTGTDTFPGAVSFCALRAMRTLTISSSPPSGAKSCIDTAAAAPGAWRR